MPPGSPAAVEWRDGHLSSSRFADVYFSRSGGLAETRAVFLAGCGLPDAWAGRRHFTVAELGFGTGLNVLALLQLWAAHRPAGGRLHIFSVEAWPLSPADARAAHAAIAELADPGLAPLSAQLLAQWPRGARGLHRIAFPELGATLDLMIADAAEAIAQWDGAADAWFLDGFSPARNPGMWGEDLLAQVGARTAPGGRAATYTVAGHVRRGLAASGFAVERMPGFGSKRQRLEALRPGTPQPAHTPAVAIIGAGIAGASLARAFRALGIETGIFAAGPTASANPAALVTPRLAAGSADAAALHAASFRAAVARYREIPGAALQQGVVRLLPRPEDVARAEATIASSLFETGSLEILAGENAAALICEETAPPALHIHAALVVRPDVIRAAWAGDCTARQVASLSAAEGIWRLLDDDGARIAEAGIVVLAAGIGSASLGGLNLRAIRGQVSIAATPLPGAAASWGGYVAPTGDGLLFGATHDRDDAGWDVRAADNARNRATLASTHPALAAGIGPVAAVAGVRAATPHHQPIAGKIAPGLFALTGLGGRGFALAPLLAEHVAARVAGVPSPLPRNLSRLLGV